MEDEANQLQPGVGADVARVGGARAVGRPLIVGEVLHDVFPDGSERLGGAPFNVAWHLQALGLNPLLITRVGTDEPGHRILREMDDWGLDTSGVQQDVARPTGRVRIRLDNGNPSFEIEPDQAYDYLDDAINLPTLVGGPAALLYHGTLISRFETSRHAVQSLRGQAEAPVFLDVNLRDPWWSEGTVKQSLLGARWVKLNADELRALTASNGDGECDLLEAARSFLDAHALEMVVVTRGADGAAVVLRHRVLEQRPPVIVRPEDTVGAGDAFSAVLIAGLVAGWDPEECLGRALDLAAVICTVRGAVSHDRGLYGRLLEQWEEAP